MIKLKKFSTSEDAKIPKRCW